MELWTLFSVVVGATLGLFISLFLKEYDKCQTRRRLTRIVKVELYSIRNAMESEEKKRIESYQALLSNPRESLFASKYFRTVNIIETLGEQLFYLNDPLPEKIVQLGKYYVLYKSLFSQLTERCNDLTLGCNTHQERLEKAKQPWYKDEMKPVVKALEETRKKIIEIVNEVEELIS